MHTLTGNRDQVLKLMNDTIMKMQTDPETAAAAAGLGEGDDADVLTKLNLGYMEEQASGGLGAASLDFSEQQNTDWYVPRNQAVAVFRIARRGHREKFMARGWLGFTAPPDPG